MSGWGIFLYLGIGSLVSLEPPPKPIPVNPDFDDEFQKKSPEDAQPTEEETEQQIVEYEDIEAGLVLQLQRVEVTARIEELESQITLAEDSARQFGERMASLRTSDSGRRLATSDNARRFEFLSSYAKEASARAARQDLSYIKGKIETARYPLGEMNDFYATFARIQSELESWQRKVEIANSTIDQLLRDNSVVQPMTLKDAIDRLTTTETTAVKQAVDARLQEVRDMQATELNKAKVRKDMLESDVNDAKRKLSAVEKYARQQIDSAKRAAEETKQAREAELAQSIARMEAGYPAVRDLLVPFTKPGYRQIGLTGRLETTADKQPLSYSGLLRRGVLENSDRGIEGLFKLVQPARVAGQNDRPMGAFPEYNAVHHIKNAITREKVKQAQAFIRLHGNAMVKTGLLSE